MKCLSVSYISSDKFDENFLLGIFQTITWVPLIEYHPCRNFRLDGLYWHNYSKQPGPSTHRKSQGTKNMSTHLTEHYFLKGIFFPSELSLDLLQKILIDVDMDLFLDSWFSISTWCQENTSLTAIGLSEIVKSGYSFQKTLSFELSLNMSISMSFSS